jgi:hypothetical protein
MEAIITNNNESLEQLSSGNRKEMITTGLNTNIKNTRWWGQISFKDEYLVVKRTGKVIDASP